MRTELFWLLSFGGFAAVSLLCGLLVWPQLSAAWPSIEEKIDKFRRQPPLVKLVLLLFVGVFVVFGSTKTNLIDRASGTNIVMGASSLGGRISVKCVGEEVVGGVSGDAFHGNASTEVTPTVTQEDIARGWQLWEVRTNGNISYTMPEGATLATNWWVRGAYEDVKRVEWAPVRDSACRRDADGTERGRLFLLGTNEYDSVWAFSWGKLRFVLGDAESEIAVVGAPMSAVPYHSRLWSAADTNGARLVTWENFVLGRALKEDVGSLTSGETPLPLCSPLPLCCAQVELRTTGDFIVRSNEVESVYRRVDDFDWDGDGIPNWNDWAPYWYDGDYTGQDELYREWVDECVGTGLENGYYKLTATFPQAGFRRTVLTVGWEEIVVAEPGEYVFLLEKGNEYAIGMNPFVDGVVFGAVDDIPEAGAGPMLLMAANGHWEGRWSDDDGRLYLMPPQLGEAGCVMWTPKLRVSPWGWSPSADDPSETFTAMLFDRTDWMTAPTYGWTRTSDALTFDTPSAATTRATWRMGQPEGIVAHLSVSFGQWALESDLVFRRFEQITDPSDYATCWLKDLPDTLFVNDDNDVGGTGPDCDHPDVSDDDIPCALIRLSSSVPTNGTIRIDNMEGFTGFPLAYVDGGSMDTRAVFTGSTWDVQDATERSIPLFINAVGKSDGFETSQIKIRWTPEEGQEETFVRRFTVVRPVAEPVCTETKRVVMDGRWRNLAYNPCGVVVGRDAYFKIRVEPEDYPDSMIAWECSGEGSVRFVGSSHGREVRVRGVSPGDVTLSAKLGNCISPPPSFTFRVVTNRTVRLSAWIISDENNVPARSLDEVRNMVKTANDIYMQVGVTLDLGDRITVTNIPAAYDINESGGANGRWDLCRLADVASNTGGLECYFVNRILNEAEQEDGNEICGVHSNGGLVVASSGTGVTLAHEVGHAFHMHDIYSADHDKMPLLDGTRFSYLTADWNNGCNSENRGCERYYTAGLTQGAVIVRLLMDGRKSDVGAGTDITYGPVYGFGADGHADVQNAGFFDNPHNDGTPVHQ